MLMQKLSRYLENRQLLRKSFDWSNCVHQKFYYVKQLDLASGTRKARPRLKRKNGDTPILVSQSQLGASDNQKARSKTTPKTVKYTKKLVCTWIVKVYRILRNSQCFQILTIFQRELPKSIEKPVQTNSK